MEFSVREQSDAAGIALEELRSRHARCRSLLEQFAPGAKGLLVFNRVNIYYFTGTPCNGVFWLPLEGEPVLMAKRSLERALADSPLPNIVPYRSFKDIPGILEGLGQNLPAVAAAEQSSLPWAMADQLQKQLSSTRFVSGDTALARLRAVKSPYELEKMRMAGARHNESLISLVPAAVRPGMTELDIARRLLDIFISQGHAGTTRLQSYGEESFSGTVAVGENSLVPGHNSFSHGYRGLHPAVPFLGSPTAVWQPGGLLGLDNAFSWQGYLTDITQVYFAGKESGIPAPVRKAQDVCLEVEAVVCGSMRAGAVPSELYAMALEIVEKYGYTDSFMGVGSSKAGFLGHGIGLFQDEWPVLAKRFDDPLEEGMIIAVEPKIAVPGFGMTGTENTWEIRDTGAVSITGAPRTIICVEG